MRGRRSVMKTKREEQHVIISLFANPADLLCPPRLGENKESHEMKRFPDVESRGEKQ